MRFGRELIRSLQVVVCLTACAGLIGTVGCGSSGGGSPVTTAPARSTLDGNWLITGTLPFVNPLSFPSDHNAFGLAMTFSVEGKQLVGGGSVNMPCGAFITVGSSELVTGSIADDGTFSARAPALARSSSLQISGSIPATDAASWLGSYTFTSNNSTCPFTLSGPITATRIADVTGTFAGTTKLSISNGLSSPAITPVTITVSLQQGAMLPGTTQMDAELFGGTIRMQGGSCVTTGMATAVPAGGVLGAEFFVTFTMDDGSTVHLHGDAEDSAVSKLTVVGLFGTGGKCGSVSSEPFEIVRQ